MNTIRIEEVETPPSNSPADVVRPLSGALETDSLAINYFELAPSESFGYAYHRHLDQEEVFYVQAGTVTFETESGDVEVGAGEVARFAPGEFQLGHNRGPERVIALAIGSPRDSEEIEYRKPCPTCERETIQRPELTEIGTLVIRCTDCESVIDEFEL